jgi:hypothetical protein
MINTEKNTFDVIKFVENYINNNIENIHKKYIDKIDDSVGNSGILSFTIYGREIDSIEFIRSKHKLNSELLFNYNYIKINFPNIFNIKKYKDIQYFKKYMLKYISIIKSNIIQNNKIDLYLIDLSINHIKNQIFLPQSIFKKEEIVSFIELFPDILRQKYEKFKYGNNPIKDLDYLDEYDDYLSNMMLFLERTYFDYIKHPDYYNSLINMLNIISSDEDLAERLFPYELSVDFNEMYLNNIESLLFEYIIKLKIESLVDKILNTNNSNLILFLIKSILYKNNIRNRNIKKIKKYLENYTIKMYKTHTYIDILDSLNIDYLKTDSSDFYYGKTILIQK